MFRRHSLINGVLSAASTPVPLTISGLALWLKADAITGLSDGDAISTWPDSSGNGKDATGTTTQRPTYKTDILNGKPVARFNGTSNGLVTSSVNLSSTSAVTVFVVATAATGADRAYIESTSNPNTGSTGWSFYRQNTGTLLQTYFTGNAGISIYNGGRVTSTRAESLSIVLDKSIDPTAAPSTGAFPYKEGIAYIGGMQAAGSNGWGTNNNNTNSFANAALYIGARNQASLFNSGDIAEVIVYARALSHAERALVDRYLIQKYALQRTTGTLACVGDSQTAGTNSTSPYPNQLAALLTTDGYDWNWGNFGMSGWQPNDMTTYVAPRVVPYVGVDGGKSIACVWAGTNSMAGGVGDKSAATAFSELKSLCTTLRTAGYKVIAATCLARNDASAGVSFETRRQAFNTSIRGDTSFYDALIDYPAADVRLDDGTSTLPAGVNSGDNVHLSNTGNGYVAALFKTTVEAL